MGNCIRPPAAGGYSSRNEHDSDVVLVHLLAEIPQAFDIEHRDHSVCSLDQPGFLKLVQNLIDALPRDTNQIAKLFVGDFDPALLPLIESRVRNIGDGEGHA